MGEIFRSSKFVKQMEISYFNDNNHMDLLNSIQTHSKIIKFITISFDSENLINIQNTLKILKENEEVLRKT